MTIRSCLAKIIPVLWCSAGLLARAAEGPVQTGLAPLVRALRQSPAPARRTAVEAFAAAHPDQAALARLALGIAAYEQMDYAAAIANLKKAQVPQLADYTAYYLAAARVEAQDLAGIPEALAPVRATEGPSPLAGKAWTIEARAAVGAAEAPPPLAGRSGRIGARATRASQPADAVRLLREHYAALPQPD